MNDKILTCNIEDIARFHPYLDVNHVIHCLVALMATPRKYSCTFIVECRGIQSKWAGERGKISLCLKWREETAERTTRTLQTYHRHHVVEQAAVALTCVLFPQIVPLCPLRVAQIGEGGDYWLHGHDYLVEISGTEQTGELERRHRQKVGQLLAGSHDRDGFVVVCCFTTQRIIFSFHHQETN